MNLATLNANVNLDITDFETGVRSVKSQMNSVKEGFDDIESAANDSVGVIASALGGAVEGFTGAFIEGAVDIAKILVTDGIEYAAELESAGRKIDHMFGENASSVRAWATSSVESFGVASGAAQRYAANAASIMSGYDMDTTAIYKYSTALVELAGDLSAFYGMDFDTVWNKLTSGLRGETEAIEDLSIFVNAATLEDKFGKDIWDNMTEVEKSQKRLQHILESGQKIAGGYYAKNQDTYSAQLAEFNANIVQLKQTIGEWLLPVVTDLLTLVNDLFGGSESASEAFGGLQEAFVASAVDIDLTVERANNLITALAELEASGEGGGTTWTAIVDELKKTLPELSGLIDNNTGEIVGGTEALSEYVAQWKATNTEIVRTNLLQQSQNELLKREMEVESLRNQVAVARLATTDPEEALADWYEDVRAAYEMPEYYDPIDIATELGEYLAQDDALAQYFERRYDAILDSGDNLESLESQLMAAEHELADAQAANAIMLERIATLLEYQETTVNVYIGDEQVTEVVSTQQGREAAKNAKTN